MYGWNRHAFWLAKLTASEVLPGVLATRMLNNECLQTHLGSIGFLQLAVAIFFPTGLSIISDL